MKENGDKVDAATKGKVEGAASGSGGGRGGEEDIKDADFEVK